MLELRIVTYIFPRDTTSFFPVVGSVLTTASGVPTRKVPSRISTPRIIGSRLQNAAMILSLQGQTAWGAASFRFASVISLLYFVKASNK
jgi:hypothetical protein